MASMASSPIYVNFRLRRFDWRLSILGIHINMISLFFFFLPHLFLCDNSSAKFFSHFLTTPHLHRRNVHAAAWISTLFNRTAAHLHRLHSRWDPIGEFLSASPAPSTLISINIAGDCFPCASQRIQCNAINIVSGSLSDSVCVSDQTIQT